MPQIPLTCVAHAVSNLRLLSSSSYKATSTFEVRIVPIPPGTEDMPEGTTCAWAILADEKPIVGGPAASFTEAAARGEIALKFLRSKTSHG